jgi:hypothetical protein
MLPGRDLSDVNTVFSVTVQNVTKKERSMLGLLRQLELRLRLDVSRN